MKIIHYKLIMAAFLGSIIPLSGFTQEKALKSQPLESKPAIQKIDDITGYVKLLGNEEFRGSAGIQSFNLAGSH